MTGPNASCVQITVMKYYHQINNNRNCFKSRIIFQAPIGMFKYSKRCFIAVSCTTFCYSSIHR